MNRAKQMEDKRLMTFEEPYNRRRAGRLTADDAAEILGVSTRMFWSRRARYEDEEDLYDRRLDRISSKKVSADETMKVLELFETRHFDCSALLSRRTGGRLRFRAELRPASPEASERRTGSACAATRRFRPRRETRSDRAAWPNALSPSRRFAASRRCRVFLTTGVVRRSWVRARMRGR